MINFPDIKVNRIAVKLSSASERAVKKGHPWIFEKGIIKETQGAKAGDLAIIFDDRKNKFLAVGLYDPFSPIRIKLLQFHTKAEIGENWFRQKIEEAYEKRKKLLETDTDSYRLIFGENDFFPGLIVDCYNHAIVIKLYSHIWFPYLYQIVPILKDISGAVCGILRLSRNLISSEETFGLKNGSYLFGSLEDENVLFREHGVKFKANLIHGHKTGFFLDHRENRRLVGTLSENKEVLDVFSYAGGFSVHALVGGAKSVTSLDISSQALDLASANVDLNKDQIKGTHKTIAQDAFEALGKLVASKKKFDLVIIDPPSFAKSAKEIPAAENSYARLAKLGIKLTKPDGVLLLASCSSRISADDFFRINQEAIQRENSNLRLKKKTFHDVDHPVIFEEGRYLKAAYYSSRDL